MNRAQCGIPMCGNVHECAGMFIESANVRNEPRLPVCYSSPSGRDAPKCTTLHQHAPEKTRMRKTNPITLSLDCEPRQIYL